MSATTFKNAVRRREHFERSQPAARSKYGLLEKHTDYVERAKHFHDKEKRITALRSKAENRNKDEFYFKMSRGKTKKGVHGLGRGDNSLTADMLKTLKTQDLTYLNSKKVAEDRKIERLQSSLHVIAAAVPRSHLVFEEQGEKLPETAVVLFSASGKEACGVATEADRAARKKRKRQENLVDASYSELSSRIDRSDKIAELVGRVELSNQLLRKGRRVKLTVQNPEGETVTAFRWKPQRAK
jgi:U3 small nucleolar RNA-associated protein 11